ncbi:MAG: DUF503 domain-containing protein [Phycisphaerae bacterium]|nr:DUF503 domain-containing protein [Phycisphaerae bacterium]
MIVALFQFELLVRGSESLKDKRRVVKSVKDRLHREHLAAVAEVGRLDSHTVAQMALALVGTDGRHLGEVLDAITNKLRALLDAELGACSRRFIRDVDDLPDSPDDTPDRDALAAEMLRHFDAPERP